MNTPPKYIFRMTHSNNIAQFVADGAVCALNTKHQPQWSINYANIVNRRQQQNTHGINDKIAFYFSPITMMAYAIHKGRVDLICPNNTNQGAVNMNDVVFMIVDIKIAITKKYQFTDQAYNKVTQIAQIYNNWQTEKNNIQWNLFNEKPYTAKIPEIGYNGVCKYAHNRHNSENHMNRKDIRMAEFWIFDKLYISDIKCFITKTLDTRQKINNILAQSQYKTTPVYCKRGVYF